MRLLQAVAGLVTAASAPHADTVRLTLDRALQIADSTSTTVQVAIGTVQLSGSDVLRRYGAFLPGASIAAGYQREGGTTFLSQNTTVPTDALFSMIGYHLSVGYNIFNGLRDRAALQGALASQESAQWDVTRARQQVAYDVTQAYLQVILDRSLVEIARQNLALSETREAQLTELVRVGRNPPPDLYRQQAQTGADSAAVVDAVNRQLDDQIALVSRLRLPLDQEYQLAAPTDDTLALSTAPDGTDAMAAHASASRPDVRSAEASTRAADAAVRAARGERLPRVDLGADVFGVGRVFDREIQGGTNLLPDSQRELWSQLFPQSAYSVTLGVTWQIFDRRVTQFDIARAEFDRQNAQLHYDDTRIRAAAEVRQAATDYRSAAQRLVATQSGMIAADTAFAAIQARFDAGLSTFVDVLTTQTLLTQTRALHAEAVIRFALSKKLLALALGENSPPR
jgi:outer membrane protein